MAKKSIVTLRVYKGKKVLMDENGKVENENHLVKIQHGSFEWMNFMKMASKNGYCKIDVEEVNKVSVSEGKEQIEKVEDIESIKSEVQNALKPNVEAELTPDQKRIADLEAKLEKFMNQGSDKKDDSKEDSKDESKDDEKTKGIDVKDATDENDYPKDPEKLREYYEELMGKKPHHKAADETLIEQMNEFKAKNNS